MENKNLELLSIEYDFSNLPQDIIAKTFNFNYGINPMIKSNLTEEQYEKLEENLDTIMEYISLALVYGFSKTAQEELSKYE